MSNEQTSHSLIRVLVFWRCKEVQQLCSNPGESPENPSRVSWIKCLCFFQVLPERKVLGVEHQPIVALGDLSNPLVAPSSFSEMLRELWNWVGGTGARHEMTSKALTKSGEPLCR